MKLAIQRVNKASVSVDKKLVGKIDKGLLVLVGVGQEDTKEDSRTLAEKLSKMRIMADEKDKMNLSIKDVEGGILAVSQFSLFADTKKGNRPSFIKAAQPEKAREVYDSFVETLREYGIHTETGRFGAYMDINVELDGPVTIVLNSKE